MGHRFSKSIVSKDKDPSDVKNTASESISKEIDDHNNQLKQDNNNKVTNQNLQEKQPHQQDFIQSQKFTSASTSTKTTTYPMNNKNLTSTITSTTPSTSLLSSSLSTSSTSSVSASTSSSVGQQFIIKIQLTKMETDPPITTNFEIINNENNQNNRNFSSININNDLINHSNLVTTESTSGNMGNKNSINIKTIEKSEMNNFNNNSNNSGNSNNNNLEQRNRFIDNSINNLNINNKRISISDQTNNTIEQINNNITEVMNDLNSQLEKCNLKLNKDDIIENIPLPDYQTMNAVDINNKQTNVTNNDNTENLEKDVCDKKQHCSRRKKLLTTSGYPLTKRKCCKCCCRDNGTKKIQETIVDSNSKNINSTSSKDQQQKSSSNSKSSSEKSWTSRFTSGLKNKSSSSESKTNITHNKTQSNNSQQNKSVSTTNSKTSAPAPTPTTTSVASTVMVVRPQSTNTVPLLGDRFNNHSGTNQLAIWADNQMLVVQLPQASQLVLERFENVDGHGGIHQTTSRADAETQSEFNNCSNNKTVNAQNQWPPLISGIKFTTPIGPKVHSQEDFIHCLVPDLEKITASSFYWGKMDRYEAERLLDGKPEGTFLLRDSAQEEYLFSVTFRKYDRSLHARIEQLNHKFSFDCHDPGVFTAPTVTGLLEHYKDPTCVMFFEPMLTIPLNRNFPFSLQQLCRATITSNVSYDGINELQLPNSLKSYLKEYHYKLRVRVKPFDETFYTCS